MIVIVVTYDGGNICKKLKVFAEILGREAIRCTLGLPIPAVEKVLSRLGRLCTGSWWGEDSE